MSISNYLSPKLFSLPHSLHPNPFSPFFKAIPISITDLLIPDNIFIKSLSIFSFYNILSKPPCSLSHN